MMLTTLTYMFVTLDFGFQINPIDYCDLEFASGSGWTRESGRTRGARYRRSSDGASFSIVVERVPESRDLNRAWKEATLTSAIPTHKLHVAPSGWKLGDDVFYWKGSGGDSVMARIGRNIVRVQSTYRGIGAPGDVQCIKDDPTGDLKRVEGGVRHAVARLAAASFTTVTGVIINGQSITGTLRDESHHIYVPLDTWAAVRGINFVKNQLSGTATFTFDSKNVILALGTERVKLDGQWQSLGQKMVRKGSKWYVPQSGIESLIR